MDANDYKLNYQPDYYVYTDGACSNNGSKYAQSGIGIFFGINDKRNVSKRIEGKQTNNTAEISAIIETYKIIEPDINANKKITIVSDSEYAIKCVTSYGKKCYDKKWNLDIPNKELVKQCYELYKDKQNVNFIHCRAHTNKTDIHSIGNDYADKLANESIISTNNNLSNEIKKIYLEVPYSRKEEIKQLGGKWDPINKKWFINENNPNKGKIEFDLVK
jgi:ribonuclease HI